MSLKLDTDFVARTLGMDLPKPVSLKRISIDSRDIAPDDLFIALKGDSFDGHAYIATSIEKGASAILCERIPESVSEELKSRATFFVVPSSLDAFRKLAHAWRLEFKGPVIAVAGSVGKTTTKELLAQILRCKWSRVASTLGSQNGYLGIPLTLFQLTPDTDAIIVEIGIDEIGAM
ncbi:MAG: UDP-N-acetylmuramoyl-tripeptide--D-alanyl-D-alanine ligase, partial [Proteobacteria bacterium]